MKETHWITTWFHQDGKESEGRYANVGSNSSDQYVQDVYWRCVYVFFHSSCRVNLEARHVLFTNAGSLPTVDGLCMRASLEELGVLIVQLDYSFSPPIEFPKSWRNQFYVFDCIKWLQANARICDYVGLFDSDIVWLRPIENILGGADPDIVYAYDLQYSDNKDIHGITLEESRFVYEALDRKLAGVAPRYYGGEFFLCGGGALNELMERITFAWEQSMMRWARSERYFTEEAHVLSFAYASSGLRVVDLSRCAKRIWTSFKGYRNSSSSDLDLVMWHLPSEKRFGFKRYFKRAARAASGFDSMSADEYLLYVSGLMNVPSLSLRNRIINNIEHARWKLKGVIRRGVW